MRSRWQRHTFDNTLDHRRPSFGDYAVSVRGRYQQSECVDDATSPSAWTMPPVRVRGRCRREVSVEKDAYDADFIGVYGVRNDVVAAARGIMAELEQRRIANGVRGRNSPIALAGLLTT